MCAVARKNIELNKTPAELFEYGWSDKTEEISIIGHATNSFGLGKGPFLKPDRDTTVVKMVNANDVLNTLFFGGTTEVGLLKIDTEGFEERIIPSISKENLTKINNIMVECHSPKKTKIVEKYLVEQGMNIEHTEERQLKMNKLTILIANWKK
jgi:FkbM family methyltransferase